MNILKKLLKSKKSPYGIRGYRFIGSIIDVNYITHMRLYDKISDFSKDIRGGELLDFGCGNKPYKQLFMNVDKYIGVDIEVSGHDHEKEDIEYYWDGNKLPFENESFDYVISTEVFEHIFNLDNSLDEISRIMKKGGQLLVTVPFVWEEHERPYDFARYSNYGIEFLLKKHGFSIERREKSCTYLESVAQLKNTYWEKVLFNKAWYPISMLLRLFISFPITAFGVIFSRLLPDSDELYLDNVILARKC